MIPKVTIITVSFNSESTIRDTLESVISQDYPNIEFIVVDGGSTDRTMEIVCEYREQISIILHEPDEGIYDAMNKGLEIASGDFIGMLNSDDVYIGSSIISTVVQKLCESNSPCFFADLLVVDKYNLNRTLRYYDSSKFSPKKFKYGWMPAHPTFFAAKEVYDCVGKFAIDFKISADFEMLIRILYVKNFKYIYYNRPIIKMRIGGASSAGLYSIFLLNLEIVRACKSNNIYTNLFLLLFKIPYKLLERFKGFSLWVLF